MLRGLFTFLIGWLLLAGLASGSLALEPGAAPGERRVALVIGNGTYSDSPVLKNPANDGRAMARLLERLGFEVLSGIDVDRATMENLIDQFANKVDAADVALAFYAGHGIQVDGRNYLLPTDAKLGRRHDVRRLIDAQVLVDEAGRAKRLALVILDACRDNPLARSLQAKERSLGVGRGLAVVQGQLGNTLVAYATAADATAADGEGANSPYTTALLEHLATPGLEVGLAFRRVRDTVIARTNGRQRPFTYGSLGGEELYLVPKPVPVPPPPVAVPTDYGSRDRLAFEAIRDSRRSEDFAIFLQAYPESALAPFARSRFEELRTQATAALSPPAPPAPPTEPRTTTVTPPVVQPPSAAPPPPQAQIVEASLRLSKADWTRIQQALTALGYDTRGSDGHAGPNTRRAISEWQKRKNQDSTGYLSPLQRDLVLAEAEPRLAALEAARTPLPPSAAKPEPDLYPEAPPSPPAKAAPAEAPPAEADDSGEVFKDCAECPEMVMVPAGSFLMGSPVDEPRRVGNEGPQHRVRIGQPFAIGRFEVTFAEWDACVADGGCSAYTPGDEGWGRGSRPVINVSWDDAQAYAAWLSEKTGNLYRLPSEAEWEYAARAGSMTAFHVGRSVATEQANYDGTAAYEGGTAGEFRQGTIEVGSLAANAWGLYDVHGNAAEWTADCTHAGYARAPDDGSAWTSGGDCSERIHRGGSWYADPWNLRSAARQSETAAARDTGIGFRVVRAIAP